MDRRGRGPSSRTASRKLLLSLITVVLLALSAPAAVHYVNLGSTNATPPYLDWTTAALTIQDAIDAATNDDTVMVTNGLYDTGGRVAAFGTVTNRVAVTKPLTVQSVNGPAVTVIQGYTVPVSLYGDAAIRCAYLTNGASLLGFTLTNGATGGSTAPNPKLDQMGGGAYCESSAVVSNCVLVGNTAYMWGGGASCDLYPGAKMNNCTIARNSAYDAGGVWGGTLNNCLIISNISSRFGGGTVRGTASNCTLVGNRAVATGGGAYLDYDGVLNNCIIYDNTAEHSPNCYLGASVNSCCTTPLPSNGVGNITNAPLFVDEAAGSVRLQSNSPCINAGDNAYATNQTDVEGNPRIIGGQVDIGAYEFQGPIHYVSMASTNPMAPYSDWDHAATNIQDAVDAAAAGDTVLVTNGVYASGGRQPAPWAITNRVAVTNGLILRSVNGPGSTFIVGYQPSGMSTMTNAVRCVALGTNCLLSGFTLTNGSAGTGNDVNGGGLECGHGSTAVVTNCVLSGNVAPGGGGGACNGTLINCILRGNCAGGGGAAIGAGLINCIVTNNTAGWAAGGLSCTATNCLFALNHATNYGGATGFSTLVNCTVMSNWLQAGSGGNGGGSYKDTVLNSIVYGNSAPNGPNCYSSGLAYSCTTPLAAGTGNITNTPLFVDMDGGNFRLQSGSPCIDAGYNAYITSQTDIAGQPRIVGGAVDIGAYESQGFVRYVDISCATPLAPYSAWAYAATNIQDAVDAAADGDTILVTNGVYASGGTVVYGAMTNRVAVTKPVSVESVNGPLVTTIQGHQAPGATNGDEAVRCIYLTNGASLSGFTLAGGATRRSGNTGLEQSGGGLLCGSVSVSVSNCILQGNLSAYGGAGAYCGTLTSCVLISNAVVSGRGWGGGAWNAVLNRCTLVGNKGYEGGGAKSSLLNDCLLNSNSASYGGGTDQSVLNNCTLIRNFASWSGGGLSGGSPDSFANNCIVYYNSSPRGNDWYGISLTNCCTYPLPGGDGNITNAPLFVDQPGGNFQLQSNSPCINAGTNAYAPSGSDLAGAPRIVGGTVDMGAYECQSPALLDCYTWLQSYDLSTYSSSLYTDADHDGMNNWQEWVAGTNPTNAASILRLESVSFTPASLWMRWNSDPSHTYFVQRATSLNAPSAFRLLQTNVHGQVGWTEFTDTKLPVTGSAFYRIGTTNSGKIPLLEKPVYTSAKATLTWPSVTNRSYFVERSSSLSGQLPFALIGTNIPGLDGTTSFTDANPPAHGAAFYRIGVQ